MSKISRTQQTTWLMVSASASRRQVTRSQVEVSGQPTSAASFLAKCWGRVCRDQGARAHPDNATALVNRPKKTKGRFLGKEKIKNGKEFIQ